MKDLIGGEKTLCAKLLNKYNKTKKTILKNLLKKQLNMKTTKIKKISYIINLWIIVSYYLNLILITKKNYIILFSLDS